MACVSDDDVSINSVKLRHTVNSGVMRDAHQLYCRALWVFQFVSLSHYDYVNVCVLSVCVCVCVFLGPIRFAAPMEYM